MGKDQLPLISSSAVQCELLTSVPAELLTAQCILESGWLDHAPGNNCFGIKAYPNCSGTQLLSTREWFTFRQSQSFIDLGKGRTAALHSPSETDALGRQLYDCQDLFATFPDLTSCFAKRASLFSVGRYAPFASQYRIDHDLTAYIQSIAPIYATSPIYSSQLLELISQPDIQASLSTARSTAT